MTAGIFCPSKSKLPCLLDLDLSGYTLIAYFLGDKERSLRSHIFIWLTDRKLYEVKYVRGSEKLTYSKFLACRFSIWLADILLYNIAFLFNLWGRQRVSDVPPLLLLQVRLLNKLICWFTFAILFSKILARKKIVPVASLLNT